MVSAICYHFWQVCSANLCDRHEYAKRLAAIGFEQVRVESIYDDTMVPFSRYCLTELAKPEVLRGISRSVATMLMLPAWSILDDKSPFITPDYVMAVAEKPRV